MGTDLGRPGSFEWTYRQERGGLIRLAFLLSGSREVAEDVVQTVFAEVHERWSSIEHPPSYLRRAVINRTRDVQRRRLLALRAPAPVEGSTGDPDVDEVWAHIVSLPAVQRAVVVLHFYEDLALGDVARLLDRNPATVRSDLRRALHRLERTLR